MPMKSTCPKCLYGYRQRSANSRCPKCGYQMNAGENASGAIMYMVGVVLAMIVMGLLALAGKK
jgi:hypothetical protein